jgi:hypothetical protein
MCKAQVETLCFESLQAMRQASSSANSLNILMPAAPIVSILLLAHPI